MTGFDFERRATHKKLFEIHVWEFCLGNTNVVFIWDLVWRNFMRQKREIIFILHIMGGRGGCLQEQISAQVTLTHSSPDPLFLISCLNLRRGVFYDQTGRLGAIIFFGEALLIFSCYVQLYMYVCTVRKNLIWLCFCS
jgi:hypothetical protein